MNLRDEILKEHSKKECTKIVQWVGHDQKRFDELFNLFIKDEYRVVQRAAWPVSYCVQSNPHFIDHHFAKLVKNLQQPKLHDAVKRNTVRFLQTVAIPRKLQGAIMDICFGYLQSPSEPVAVKVFSMTVLSNLSKEYPEILPELKLMVEGQLVNQSAGFKSRAKKLRME
jgi:hypothetical protein